MKNIVNKLNKNRWLVLSFLLSTFVLFSIYILQKIAPFGVNSMLDVDFYHQYGPLLNELHDRVLQGESLLYSFNTGLGIPFYRNFLNYLSSPFNIVLFLFKKEHIVMAFSFIIGLKVIFASCTMSFYLKKTFNKSGVLAAIFGTLYAFSGYFCAYYWNIMWIDGIVFLPIIAYGINKLIDEDKLYIYIISLAIMLFANYFIAYMICIFAVGYFLGYLIYRYNFKFKTIFKKSLLFGISSVLAAGLVAFALLPLFKSLSSISATGGSFPDLKLQFTLSNYLFNHISSVNRTVFASDILPLPNVYPGLLTLVSILLLFMNKKINIKFKFISLISIIFFFIIFNITSLDYIMHAFHVPNDLPWRYSFLYVFVLCSIGYYSFSRIKDISIVKIAISFGIVIIICLLASKFGFENIDDKRVIMMLILLILYYIIVVLLCNTKKYNYLLYGILLISVSFEMIYSINTNWEIDHEIETFMSDKPKYQELINYAKSKDNDLYRIEKSDYLTLNDGAWYDYTGVSTFTSMAYESVAKSQRNLGLSGNNINSYYYRYYQTPVYNTIFNIKYILGDYLQNDYYSLIKSNNTANLIRYNNASSVAFAVNKELKKWETYTYEPFKNQSNFVTLSKGINDVYLPVKVKEVTGGKIINNSFSNDSNGSFTYTTSAGSKKLDLVLENNTLDNIYIYVGGSDIENFYIDDNYYSITSDEYYIIDTGKKTGDIKVSIGLKSSKSSDLTFYAYRINKNNFEKWYDEINKERLVVEKYNDTHIEGTLNALNDEMVFTSISYDKGWTVLVDGKKVNTYKIDDAYLGFDITSGNHKIVLKYYPDCMKLGLIITLTSFATTLYIILKPNNKNKNTKKDEFIV